MDTATTRPENAPKCRECGDGMPFGCGIDICMRCAIKEREKERAAAPLPAKRSIYHKEIPISAEDADRGHVVVDVYRVLRAFGVTDHNLGHAIKKLLVPGQRSGGKSADQDVAEAIWTLQRWQEMNREDEGATP